MNHGGVFIERVAERGGRRKYHNTKRRKVDGIELHKVMEYRSEPRKRMGMN